MIHIGRCHGTTWPNIRGRVELPWHQCHLLGPEGRVARSLGGAIDAENRQQNYLDCSRLELARIILELNRLLKPVRGRATRSGHRPCSLCISHGNGIQGRDVHGSCLVNAPPRNAPEYG